MHAIVPQHLTNYGYRRPYTPAIDRTITTVTCTGSQMWGCVEPLWMSLGRVKNCLSVGRGVMGILLQKETQSLDVKWAKKGYNWV